MLGFIPIFFALQSCFGVIEAATYPRYPPDAVDKLAADSLHKLAEYQAKYHPNNTCTIENAIKRREW